MKVVIDRATWRTGRYGEHAGFAGFPQLLNVEGFRCCLGFLGSACEIADKDLHGYAVPLATIENEQVPWQWPSRLFEYSQHDPRCIRLRWQTVFAQLNDATNVDDDDRESWIAAGFKTVLGFDTEFVGSYPEVQP